MYGRLNHGLRVARFCGAKATSSSRLSACNQAPFLVSLSEQEAKSQLNHTRMPSRPLAKSAKVSNAADASGRHCTAGAYGTQFEELVSPHVFGLVSKGISSASNAVDSPDCSQDEFNTFANPALTDLFRVPLEPAEFICGGEAWKDVSSSEKSREEAELVLGMDRGLIGCA
jgi:hypothetical protein